VEKDEMLNDLPEDKAVIGYTKFEVYQIRRFDRMENMIKALNTKIDNLEAQENDRVKSCDSCRVDWDQRFKELHGRIEVIEADKIEEKGRNKTFLGIGSVIWAIALIIITAIVTTVFTLLFQIG
jgi:hypothetical protein